MLVNNDHVSAEVERCVTLIGDIELTLKPGEARTLARALWRLQEGTLEVSPTFTWPSLKKLSDSLDDLFMGTER